ncbi:MAG TPA: farnesyl-diphosphate synthase, partial [Lachnospiraceae bacterium]|nr:farnesyl-diphosphate synthase [Lachnospiraceae bacterium]
MRMVNSENFDKMMAEKVEYVQNVIKSFLPKKENCPETLYDALVYSMEAGGKRLRPILMLETYRLFGGNKAVIEPFMAAIEMIHTSSLIHDDLPAIDNDELRRGRKTTHAVYGEAMGILSGDALLNYAYETALEAFRYNFDRDSLFMAMKVLAAKTGIYGMLGGQSVDVENDKKGNLSPDLGMLEYIHKHKTSALIEAPMMIGAILAGAQKGEISCVEEIGGKIGLAFQIRDDILDVISTDDVLGKPVRSDAKNEKVTYADLLGLEAA